MIMKAARSLQPERRDLCAEANQPAAFFLRQPSRPNPARPVRNGVQQVIRNRMISETTRNLFFEEHARWRRWTTRAGVGACRSSR
jgi:hypothetical protein